MRLTFFFFFSSCTESVFLKLTTIIYSLVFVKEQSIFVRMGFLALVTIQISCTPWSATSPPFKLMEVTAWKFHVLGGINGHSGGWHANTVREHIWLGLSSTQLGFMWSCGLITPCAEELWYSKHRSKDSRLVVPLVLWLPATWTITLWPKSSIVLVEPLPEGHQLTRRHNVTSSEAQLPPPPKSQHLSRWLILHISFFLRLVFLAEVW